MTAASSDCRSGAREIRAYGSNGAESPYSHASKAGSRAGLASDEFYLGRRRAMAPVLGEAQQGRPESAGDPEPGEPPEGSACGARRMKGRTPVAVATVLSILYDGERVRGEGLTYSRRER